MNPTPRFPDASVWYLLEMVESEERQQYMSSVLCIKAMRGTAKCVLVALVSCGCLTGIEGPSVIVRRQLKGHQILNVFFSNEVCRHQLDFVACIKPSFHVL